MSEYAQDETSSPPRHGGSDTNLPESLDDSANTSIIGKVKSRVSSILPNRLSKWFSPSTKLPNDSLNGSLRGEASSQPTRRRRRLEVEEEEENFEDRDVQYSGEFRNSTLHLSGRQERNFDVDDENDNDEDDNQNSEYEYKCSSIKQTKKDLNVERQPPAKRSRLNIEVRDSPYLTRNQPLLSSTPDIACARFSNSTTSSPTSRYHYQRYTHLNLYGNQHQKELAFNFGQQRDTRSEVAHLNTDTINLIPANTSYERENLAESTNIYGCRNSGLSSRKSLNIPPTTPTLRETEILNTSGGNLKRQPLSSAKIDLSAINTMSVPPRRTSTTIHEVEEQAGEQRDITHCKNLDKHDVISKQNLNAYNGCMEASGSFSNKRQKLINGQSLSGIIIPESNEVISIDSASESGESTEDVVKLNSSHVQNRKTGLFNTSTGASTRNNSRTSSFGNGLNFYSHLEGRKSLFSGSNRGNTHPLNNSTLSLTSLNRRQFNASLYGSTSALSDSRLLNTFSPFYKGKTTYGGAAAYNKYTSGAGASAVRITPTLIRPTSSLSNLSSSNSLTGNINPQIGENSAISSTAKRILDLINDFTTPLSDAKKMASTLKINSIPHIPPQAKTRLNDNDLKESRSMRLSQVQSPYSRSSVVLQPSGNASGRGTAGGILPPIKELQVPTMSQLLQMKKMQSTTEKVRKITQNSALSTEYTLPAVANPKTESGKVLDTDQQKHSFKIRNRITKAIIGSAVKDPEEEQVPPINLPNIAFPLMQSVPKIDIQLNTKKSDPCTLSSELKSTKLPINIENSNNVLKDPLAFNFSQNSSEENPVLTADGSEKKQLCSVQTNLIIKPFVFSEPQQVIGAAELPNQNITQKEKDIYKFSDPLDIMCKNLEAPAKMLPLKEGSCLDILKKPTVQMVTSESTSKESTTSNKTLSGFGNQFQKSNNEWNCNACLVRNRSESNKCVACGTPNEQKAYTSQPAINASSLPITSSFGQQFRKSSNEWECEVCMICNKEDTTKCVACETPRKSVPSVTASLPPPIKNSFGDDFKPKAGTWVCPTCMISNKTEINECIACQHKKLGSTNATSQFKFGFTDANKVNTVADDAFTTIAAQQKVSKWECDACMTRNDSNRSKCACCEQPKPGISSAESATTNSNKFQFGATAASKFSFGFGTGSNAIKEEDLRKELSNKSEELQKSTIAFGTSQLAPTNGGFQFGIKPTIGSTDKSKTDVTDSKKQSAGCKFGVDTSTSILKGNDKVTVVSTPASLESATKLVTTSVSPPYTSAPTKSSTSVNIPSVKFSLPSTTSTTSVTNKDSAKDLALPVFGLSTKSASSTTTGFSFGSKMEANSLIIAKEKEKSTGNIAVKDSETKSLAFAFGSSAANSSTLTSASFVSSSLNTTTTIATPIKTSTTAAVNPVFSFGSNTSIVSAINSQSSPALSSFMFGSNATNNVIAAATTASSTLFGAVTSAATSTTNATTTAATKKTLSTFATATPTTASTNIFGSFGSGGSSNTSTTPIFGSSVNPPANNNLSSVSSSTNNPTKTNSPQFGAFGSKTSPNVFGSFGGNVGTNDTVTESEKGAKFVAPTFGNVAPSSTSKPNQSEVTGGFVFGSKSVNNSTVVTAASTTGSVTSTNTTWPKSSFVFGPTASSPISTITVAPLPNENESSKEVAKTSVFGTFGSTSSNSSSQQQKSSSIFGVPTSNIGPSLSSGTGSSSTTGPTSFSSNLFSTNSAPAATNIFGANPSGNAATPAPSFGSSPFGGTASSTSATPTFGSTAATGTTFGSFGGSTNSSTTVNTEVKKPEAAFNFGVTPASVAQSTSSGFNFGLSASTTKPAFNFGGTSTTQQPTFNFTGSTEGAPNAPFQFNAGAAPVSSNIFAPTPTAGAQTVQQAKRKIRAPIRRVTQR